MTLNNFKPPEIMLLFFAFLFSLPVFAQANKEDSLLVQWEKEKWEALKTGKMPSGNWFAKDMQSIGYMPDGNVYHTIYDSEKKRFVKPVDTLAQVKLPAADFILSDFKVVTASPDVKILTYQSDGPLNLYATTVWTKRSGGWTSVFYQATRYK